MNKSKIPNRLKMKKTINNNNNPKNFLKINNNNNKIKTINKCHKKLIKAIVL